MPRFGKQDIEVVAPYGNDKAAYHFRLGGENITFCGKNCESWTILETRFVEAVESAFSCNRCKKAAFK